MSLSGCLPNKSQTTDYTWFCGHLWFIIKDTGLITHDSEDLASRNYDWQFSPKKTP